MIGDPERDYLPPVALVPVANVVVPTMADLEDMHDHNLACPALIRPGDGVGGEDSGYLVT